MKKLLAIFLPVFLLGALLCTMIPFATVSAADEPTIVASTVEEANAGDEIEVEVSLMNNPGVIAAGVEIKYDPDVFELVTEWVYNEDEDEDVLMNKITKATGWSDKYTTYGPVGKCIMTFCNGTATKNVTRELFYTATFKVKDDAISGTYELEVVYKAGDFFNVDGDDVAFGSQNAVITINGQDPEPEVPACEHEYTYACDKICAKCGEESNPDAAHTIVAVDAKAPTCTEIGNVAYWYCSDCGAAWLDAECTIVTNQMSVKLGATCATNAIHTAGIEAGCHYTGLVENWYCANCDVYYLDAACTIVTNYKSLTIPALQDSAEYVEAKTPTCTENGNVEYWVCYECEQIWADEALTQLTNFKNVQIAPSCKYSAEAHEAIEAGCHYNGMAAYWYCANCDVFYADADCTIVTNYKNLIIPALQDSAEYVPAKAPTCTENGNVEYWVCYECEQVWANEALTMVTNIKNVQIAMADHSYTNAHDTSCNACGAERTLAASDIIIEGGNSVTEIKGGLGFKFDVAVNNLKIGKNYAADYSNATVAIDGVEYKLVGMGAVVNNLGENDLTLDDVNNKKIINIKAEKAFEMNGATCFAVRIINIPDAKLDAEIIVRPYYTYECDGELITIYGDNWAESYNGALNG